MRSRQTPSSAGEPGRTVRRQQLPALLPPESVYVCLVAHACLHRRAGLGGARRSFWTLGKVALRAVVAHREPAPRGCDDGVPLWEVGRQALGGWKK